MPTYEYKCDACGYAFEKFHSITARPIRKCPKCGKLKVKRLIGTGAGMIFKGSGFYETDYRRAGDTASKDEAPATNGDGKSESKDSKTEAPAASTDAPAKSESKPEPKSEPKGGGGTKKKGK